MFDAPILLTRFQGRNSDRLTKRFFIDGVGKIRKKSAPNFQKGIAERRCISSLSEIETLINDLRCNECIATGIYGEELVNVLPEAKLDDAALQRGYRSRGKKFMMQPERGLVLLDYDSNLHMPTDMRCRDPQQLMQRIQSAIPEFAGIGYVGTTSCSAGIHRIGEEAPTEGGGGLHVYLEFHSGALDALRKFLEVRLWNAGLGYIAFARNGAMLSRTLHDLSVLSAERLVFEARPVLGQGLVQTPREWVHHEGKAIDFELSVTPEEVAEFERRVGDKKRDPDTVAKAEQLYQEYRKGQIDTQVRHTKISRAEAEKRTPLLSPADREKTTRDLMPDEIVEIRGEQVAVAELLARGEELDGTAMPDPIEGSDYGDSTAMFFWNDGIGSCIHSFAHGMKTIYRLKGKQHPSPNPVPDSPGSATPATLAVDESNDARTPDVEPLSLLQQKFALLNLDGKVCVFDRERLAAPTPDGTSQSLVLSSRSDGSLLVKRAVRKWFPDLEEAKDVVDDFFSDPATACFIGVEFNPAGTTEGFLNLWQGPSLSPHEGDWSLIQEFLLTVICDGVQESYDFLIRYVAHALQFPWVKPGVMITLLGGQGTGKSTLGRVIHEIWGMSFLQVHDIHAITGSFNGCLEQVIWVFMDEALFAGDRKATDSLKSLVTEPVIQINQKHQPARQSRSFHRFIAATNALHAKNTERDDRRDFVLRVSEDRKGDHAFWTALNTQITGGGAAAMMHDLVTMDLRDFNVRKKPHTKALTDQKLRSLHPVDNWWFDALQRGEVIDDQGWPAFISTKQAIDDIKDLAGHRLFKNPTAGDVVRTILEMCPSAEKKQSSSKHSRQRGLALPPLETARAEFEGYIGGTVSW